MASLRNRLAAQIVRMIGLKRRLQALAEVEHDGAALERGVARLRRTDRRRPPLNVRGRWAVESLDVPAGELFVMSHKGRPPARRVLMYLHGGGYLFGPFGTEWAAMRHIAGGTGSDFSMVLYPRAPEHQAPATLEATHAAFAILADRYGAANVVLVGTSAGGGLAVALMAALRDAGEEGPSSAVLLSPGVDMTLQGDVAHLEGRDLMLPVDHVRSAGRIYAGELGPDHPIVSPSFGNLADLPTMHVFVGSEEILRPSIGSFAERGRAAGTEVSLVVGDGEQHTWPAAPTPEGRLAREAIIALVDAQAAPAG